MTTNSKDVRVNQTLDWRWLRRRKRGAARKLASLKEDSFLPTAYIQGISQRQTSGNSYQLKSK